MAEIDIGIGKSGRRGYSLDEVAIVPSRRTRDADEVDTSWQIDAYQFDLPVIAAAMDGVTSPSTAIEMARLGWCRRAAPRGAVVPLRGPATELLDELAELDRRRIDGTHAGAPRASGRSELIGERIAEINDAGATVCVAVSPARTEALLGRHPRPSPTCWSSRAR